MGRKNLCGTGGWMRTERRCFYHNGTRPALDMAYVNTPPYVFRMSYDNRHSLQQFLENRTWDGETTCRAR